MTIQDQRVAAAEIEGWTQHVFSNHPLQLRMPGDGPTQMRTVPNYPEDLNAAIRLVEVLEKEGWWIKISNAMPGNWHVLLQGPGGEHVSDCSSLPLAITQAALRAKGRWVQEGANE